MANKVKVRESNYSCGPLQRDDIKVSIKYFFVTVRTTQKTQRDHKERRKKKKEILVVRIQYCIPRRPNAAARAAGPLRTLANRSIRAPSRRSSRDSKTVTVRYSKPMLPHRTERDGGGWYTEVIAVHTKHQ